MRNLKFRVWRNDLKRFLTHQELYVLKINPLFSLVWTEGNSGIGADISPEIFQQFTGLFDKNGKEIYEGDMVKVKMYEDWNDDVGYEVIYEMAWCKTHSGWRGFTKSMKDKNYSGTGLLQPIGIVGNIFENPELLK